MTYICMEPGKLRKNLEKLRAAIARKPTVFTPEYAITIDQAFEKYTRTSTINTILSISEVLCMHNWPFPMYALGSKWWIPRLILAMAPSLLLVKSKELFMRKDVPPSESEQDHVSSIMTRYFFLYKRDILAYWIKHRVFEGKQERVQCIMKCYTSGLWYPCIVSALPLLDHLSRKYSKTQNFDRDITKILATFKAAGLDSKHIKPGYAAWRLAMESGEDLSAATEKDLRLVGIMLACFMDFAKEYYAYCRTDKIRSKLNRHAIIHGSEESIWTRDNATKILTFLDLMLRLQPAFEILLDEG